MKKQLLKGFHRPKNIILEQPSADDNYAKFTAYPFERGYGTTIANSLRRILLSSIQGCAITAIYVTYKSDDTSRVLSSEFEAIPGVKEDTLEIIHNLKKVCLLSDELDSPQIVSYEITKEGDISAAYLAKNNDIKVTNPDQHIMTITQDVSIEIDIQIEQGIGYRSSEQGKDLIAVSGALPVDAIFSPIERVSFEIQDHRIGNRSNYEKLMLEVWTNGTITPVDAVAEAAKIAKEHLTVFINFDETEVEVAEHVEENNFRAEKILAASVESLDLSARAGNCIKNAGVRTIGDLVIRSEADLSELKNFGRKSLEEIQNKLQELWGLRLGMHDDEINAALNSPRARIEK